MKKPVIMLLLMAANVAFASAGIHRPKYLLKSNPLDSKINIRAKRQVVRNLDDCISLLKTADGYLGGCMKRLKKARGIAVRDIHGKHSRTDRVKMAKQINGLILDNLRTLRHAQFNCRNVFGKDLGGKIWRTTLSENNRSFAIRLTASVIVITHKRIHAIATAAGLSNAISRIDQALSAVAMQRARVGAFLARIEAAFKWQMLYVREYKRLDKNEIIPDLKSGKMFHIRKLEDRLFELAVQAANGIYTRDDRKHIKLEWDQIVRELKRLGEGDRYIHNSRGQLSRRDQ